MTEIEDILLPLSPIEQLEELRQDFMDTIKNPGSTHNEKFEAIRHRDKIEFRIKQIEKGEIYE